MQQKDPIYSKATFPTGQCMQFLLYIIQQLPMLSVAQEIIYWQSQTPAWYDLNTTLVRGLENETVVRCKPRTEFL
jgi:hypothetical protein